MPTQVGMPIRREAYRVGNAGFEMPVQPSVAERHAERMNYYRAREKDSLSRLGSDPEINQRFIAEAQGWARLANARESIRAQLDDMADHVRAVRVRMPIKAPVKRPAKS